MVNAFPHWPSFLRWQRKLQRLLRNEEVSWWEYCCVVYFWHVERHTLGLKVSLICCVTWSLLGNAGTDCRRHNLSLALEQHCHILGVEVVLIATNVDQHLSEEK